MILYGLLMLLCSRISHGYVMDLYGVDTRINTLFLEIQEFLSFLKSGFPLEDVRLACTKAEGVKVIGTPRFQVSPYYARPDVRVSGPCRQNVHLETAFFLGDLQINVDTLTRGSRSAPANFTARTVAVQVAASVIDAPDLNHCSSKFRLFNVTRFDGVVAYSPESYFDGAQLGEYDTWNAFFAQMVVPYVNQELEKYNALVALESCIKLCPEFKFSKEDCTKNKIKK